MYSFSMIQASGDKNGVESDISYNISSSFGKFRGSCIAKCVTVSSPFFLLFFVLFASKLWHRCRFLVMDGVYLVAKSEFINAFEKSLVKC